MIFPAFASAQATRTWVSGVGDDVNPCSRTAPCKTLAGAISKTAAGGEINAIDSGGFGGVTITKAITIDLTPQLGGVLVPGTNGIVVQAAATDDVILRGIDYVGPASTGLSGVRINRARSVRIEQSSFSGFGAGGTGSNSAGISIIPTDANTSVVLNGVDIHTTLTGGIGILVNPTAPFTASVMVRNSTVLGFFTTPSGSPETSTGTTGIQVGLGGTAWLNNSTIFGNCFGILTSDYDNATDQGVINVYANSQLIGNWQNGTATSIIGQTNLQGPTGAPGATGATGATGAAGLPKLVVVATLKRLIARAGAGVAFGYVSTAAGTSSLTVKSGGRVVASMRGVTRSGSNALRWNGKVQGKRAKAGTYRLVLRVTGGNGSEASSSSVLVLR